MFELSNRSNAVLSTCNEDLQRVLREAIKWSPIDFGVTHGHRTPEVQFELYKRGRKPNGDAWVIENQRDVVTYKDGYKKLSKHNFDPSDAVDIYAYIGKASWDMNHLCAIGGAIMAVAAILYKEKEILRPVAWGLDWNRNGILVNKDDHEGFVDAPHFQSM